MTQRVVITGDNVPGLAGVQYGNPVRAASINNANEIILHQFVTGAGVTNSNNVGIFVGQPLALQLIVREGDQAPGFGAGAKYSDFQQPVLVDTGAIAFSATVTGGPSQPSTDIANFGGPRAAISLIARQGDPAPGTASVYQNLHFANTLNGLNQVMYTSTLSGSTNVGNALFAGPTTNPQLLARRGDPAPGTPPNNNYYTFDDFSTNNQGMFAVQGSIALNGVPDIDNQAIFVGTTTSQQAVVYSGQQAPDLPAGIAYSQFSAVKLNNAGSLLFESKLRGPNVALPNQDSLFTGPPASPRLVARGGDQAPGLSAGVLYDEFFSSGMLNDQGQVAFMALLAGNVTTTTNRALFISKNGTTQPIVIGGTQAVGLPAGVNWINMGPIGFNATGQMLFGAALAGNGVNSGNDGVLYTYDPVQGIRLVAREGTPYDIGGGVFRTVATSGIGFSSPGEDTMRVLNDSGLFVFDLDFTDGSNGVFVGSIAGVPEPASIATAGIGGLPLILRRRRGRNGF